MPFKGLQGSESLSGRPAFLLLFVSGNPKFLLKNSTLSFPQKKLYFFERFGFSIKPANPPIPIYCGTMTPKYRACTTSTVLSGVIPAPVKKAGQAGR
jgi:hypothetical protein